MAILADYLKVHCPTCQSKPGMLCTVPTNLGRNDVNWVHFAREAEYTDYEDNLDADEKLRNAYLGGHQEVDEPPC